jgi:hypothetical protein
VPNPDTQHARRNRAWIKDVRKRQAKQLDRIKTGTADEVSNVIDSGFSGYLANKGTNAGKLVRPRGGWPVFKKEGKT